MKVDLIAHDIGMSNVQPTTDWTKVCADLLPRTRAKDTKGDLEFLSKYPWSPVDLEIWVDGVKDDSLSKKYKHDLTNNSYYTRSTVKVTLV